MVSRSKARTSPTTTDTDLTGRPRPAALAAIFGRGRPLPAEAERPLQPPRRDRRRGHVRALPLRLRPPAGEHTAEAATFSGPSPAFFIATARLLALTPASPPASAWSASPPRCWPPSPWTRPGRSPTSPNTRPTPTRCPWNATRWLTCPPATLSTSATWSWPPPGIDLEDLDAPPPSPAGADRSFPVCPSGFCQTLVCPSSFRLTPKGSRHSAYPPLPERRRAT